MIRKKRHYTPRVIRNYAPCVVGIRGLIAAIKGGIGKTTVLLKIDRPDVRFPVFLRVPSSDVPTFEQIFIMREYEFDVRSSPRTIVDAGANIGLASIYFANKYPNSKLIAIEPEEGNIEVLRRNIAPYGNIIPVHGAVWHENARISLVDPGFGNWGFMTQTRDAVEGRYGEIVHEVQGMTIDTIMKEQRIEHIDILKMDIEGAEREVFGHASSWIRKVDSLIVELHEHMKLGCIRSFYNGSNGFDDEWMQGENVYLTRSRGCVTRERNGSQGGSKYEEEGIRPGTDHHHA